MILMVVISILTIVDDYTMCTWIYLLKHKSYVCIFLEIFYNMTFTQFNLKIKCLRSDNGTEFILSDFYHKLGIIHKTYCVETLGKTAFKQQLN